ncbi:MAG: hypothetical protein NVSMB2_03310 [Chloroflexota bacterium]
MSGATAGASLEQSLTAVLEISQAINLSLGRDSMLQMLAEKVHAVMSYDCAVILLDPDSLLLTWAGYYGISDAYVAEMNAQHNNLATPHMSLGATGRAYQSRQPAQVTDLGDTSVQLWQKAVRHEGIASFISTPLVFQDRVLGFINCYSRRPHVFQPAEVELLRIIGNQAAIAVEAARLFENERQRILELDRLNSLLRQGEQIHQHLTELILRDAGLEAIVDRIADLIGHPVSLYDSHRHPLAARRSLEWLESLSSTRHVVPLGTEEDGLGTLEVHGLDAPLEGLDLRAVEYGATVAALELLKQRAVSQVEQQLRGGLLDDLLGGEYDNPDSLERRARHLGFEPACVYRVLVLALDTSPSAAANFEERQRQLLDLTLGRVQAQCPGALVSLRGEVIALVCRDTTDTASLARLIRDEVRRVLPNATVSVGIGSACRDFAAFATSFAEARYCLDLIHRLESQDRDLGVEELGLHRFLVGTQNRAQLVAFAHERLDALLAYELRHAGDLLETLTCYLSEDCSLARTGKRLVLHANTVQYRLRRIQDLTRVRIRSTPGLLELQLALLIGVLVPREFPLLAPYAAQVTSAVR